ncbi:restriction endonuclease subunit S [Sphaerotilus mobilis]|uniref:Type I restriction enzyme S subunit n=1 Tax=Sphaerotilus mobilis TaxID=47994 RepID=A0A4Q7LKZ9_9BURK|nr:restriction endonuclease subunit S [Sphaerotilus mobilis]RZS54901.1 type I restriction enzyme S subunit [Sphaerotilus mobilis]
MSDHTAGGVPKIRFKGFDAAWEPKNLGQIYKERNERGDDSLPILSVSIHSGISNSELSDETLGKKVRRSEDKSLYKRVQAGDLVLNMMRAWQGALGVAKTEGMVSPAYLTAAPDDTVYPLFMDCGLRRPQVVAQMNRLSYGVTDFRKRLYWDSFVRVRFAAPSVSEQHKIASYFSNLDSMISLHQYKHEKLVVLKRATMQKMFPKPGNKIPEVRFDGFSGAWSSEEMKTLGTFSKGAGFSKGDLRASGTPIVLYGRLYTDYQTAITQVDTFVEDRKGTVKSKGNEVVVPASGETSEDIARASALLASGIIIGGDLNIISPCERLDPYFLALALSHGQPKYDLARRAQGKTVVHVRGADISSVSVSFPELREQERIAAYFRSIDELIVRHSNQIKKLQQVKLACQESMFA